MKTGQDLHRGASGGREFARFQRRGVLFVQEHNGIHLGIVLSRWCGFPGAVLDDIADRHIGQGKRGAFQLGAFSLDQIALEDGVLLQSDDSSVRFNRSSRDNRRWFVSRNAESPRWRTSPSPDR
jgi:hypothetical protein